jgi:formylglycine-generating enzyme required for sulfatase activity
MRNKNVFFKVIAAAVITAGMLTACSDGGGNNHGNGNNNIEIQRVLVEAGSFKTEDGTTVTLTEDFYISKYPVTQAQYRVVMGNNPSWFSGDNKPVEGVSWYDAVSFCEAVGGFLPTEAQWEFAARGGNNSNGYIYSGSNNLDEVGWYWSNSSSGTKDVGQKKPNELGIYDMSGNVWEWCSDWYGSYPGTVTDPTGPSSGSNRVIRGGSWGNSEEFCRVSDRSHGDPGFCNSYFLGFRAAFPRN